MFLGSACFTISSEFPCTDLALTCIHYLIDKIMEATNIHISKTLLAKTQVLHTVTVIVIMQGSDYLLVLTLASTCSVMQIHTGTQLCIVTV